jgi:GT2 family glycosyltransferase
MDEVVLSIVIGTRNRLGILQKCLESLIGKINFKHEIIVVDAGSTDGTIEYLENVSEINLVKDGKPIGQARSLNQIFKTLNSTYICWLSDDNVVLEGMLDLSVSILEQNLDIGMVALKVKDVLGPFTEAPYIGGIANFTNILNCNQGLIRTQLMRQIGYFDEAFRDYGIDADLTTKVLLTGYKVVYTKEVAILHYRDHVFAPGAFDAEERSRRQEQGNKLYKDKYGEVFKLGLRDRIRHKTGREIWKWVHLFSKGRKFKKSFVSNHVSIYIRFDFDTEYFWGHHTRDWYNVLRCQFISLLDFWHNRENPFYLVQYIPNRLRSK